MKKKHYLLIYLLSIGFYFLISALQKSPGYMDAEYYFAQGIQISRGNFLTEPFIWNYLGNPTSIHPLSFTFWMPFTAMLSAVGLLFSKVDTFFFARLMFILLAGLIPVLSAYFAERFLLGVKAGWIAAAFSLAGAFFLPYLTITDTFTPFLILGGLFFLVFDRILISADKSLIKKWGFWLIGIIVGLMHLTRADGILWLAAGGLGVILFAIKREDRKLQLILTNGLKFAVGYLLIMSPWFVRNILEFSSLFPPGNGSTLWLTSYSDIFTYPASQLSFGRWMETGFSQILLDRLSALGVNLQTLLSVAGGIILTPFIIIAIIQRRKEPVVRVLMIMLWITLGVMTLLFPYAGARGSFFHSIASIQTVLWGLAPLGIYTVIQYFVKKRNWKLRRSWRLFPVTLIILSALISAFVMQLKLVQGAEGGGNWNNSLEAFNIAEKVLISSEIDDSQTIMVNDPPGYTLATGRAAIMIPSSGLQAILEASDQYQTKYLLVGPDRVDVRIDLDKDTNLSAEFIKMFEENGLALYEINH